MNWRMYWKAIPALAGVVAQLPDTSRVTHIAIAAATFILVVAAPKNADSNSQAMEYDPPSGSMK